MFTPRVNPRPVLTRTLVQRGIFRRAPFCLVDVGASGGIDPYWDVFGDSLRAYGFDGLVNEMERLNASVAGKDQHYYPFLVGDRTYRLPEGVLDTQPFSRTSAAKAAEIKDCNYAKTYFDQTGSGVFTSEMIELDQFFLREHPEDVDFIKIDTDGSDYPVLRGARELLSRRGVLGVAVECQFHGFVHDESSTFRNIDRFLTGLGFSLFDLEVHRYSRAVLPQKFVYSLPAQTVRGQVLWGDALYLRDLGQEHYEEQWQFSAPSLKIVKLACLFEIFGLEDCAAELLRKYGKAIADIVNIDECLDVLASEAAGHAVSYGDYVADFEERPESFYPGGTSASARLLHSNGSSSVTPKFSPGRAYWNQRSTLANARGRILALSRAVDRSSDLLPYQWAQLMSVVMDFEPDLVLELGRGSGNSTCAFTEASNLNQGRTRVVSLCLSDDWEKTTLPRIRRIVSPDWFQPLEALRADILKFDYQKLLAGAKRVVLFWDAHGFEIAECVLGGILPLLAGREHVVLMHDLSDTRYSSEQQLEYGGHGIWKGNDWSGPRLKLGIIDSAVEQSVAALDFTTRNHLTLDSADHSFHTELTGEQQAEMKSLLGDLFDTQGHWFYFSLNERPGPYKFPKFTKPGASREKPRH